MSLQLPACDRCTQGVMDATNDHARGLCSCPCHGPTAQQLAQESRWWLLRPKAALHRMECGT